MYVQRVYGKNKYKVDYSLSLRTVFVWNKKSNTWDDSGFKSQDISPDNTKKLEEFTP